MISRYEPELNKTELSLLQGQKNNDFAVENNLSKK